MADLVETIDKTETLLILAALGVGAYIVYTKWSDLSDWYTNLIVASSENSYSNAASATLQHPVSTIGSILGFGQGSSGGGARWQSG